MALLLANNASARLATSLTSESTAMTVQAGKGALFPMPANQGDWFPITISRSTGELEVVKCTARTGDLFTIERGQDGTTPRAFNMGDSVGLRLTKGVIEYLLQSIETVVDKPGIKPLLDITPIENRFPVYSGGGSASLAALTAFAKTILDDPDASSALTTLGISNFAKTILDDNDSPSVRQTIGAQAASTLLTVISGIAASENTLPFFTGADSVALAAITAFARSLLDDADASAARYTLGAASSGVTIRAGAGLSGGGDLSAGREISLGTPGTIASWTGNDVSGATHTHAIDVAGIASIGSAAIGAGGIGTYAMLHCATSGTFNPGATLPGSNLRYSNADGENGGTPSGTWRSMGYCHASSNTTSPAQTTLFVRVS